MDLASIRRGGMARVFRVLATALIGLAAGTANAASTSATQTLEPAAWTPAGWSPRGNPAPVQVRALYLTGWTAGNAARLEHFLELARETEINAYVVDIKDDDGYVSYASALPEVRELNAWKRKFNAEKAIPAFKAEGVHLIGRLTCFKDPVAPAARAEWAIQRRDGGVWKDRAGRPWLNPHHREVWDYLIDIAEEALALGFDEIQFDYVRFPSEGNLRAMHFGDDAPPRHEAINAFLSHARMRLPDAILSADVFGIVCESPGDTERIGQCFESIGCDMDYLSPMVYPSHYARGQVVNGKRFPTPDLDPYGVVHHSMLRADARARRVLDYRARMRPYLQDFTATWLGAGAYQRYGARQVRQQIQAVYDAGFEEWILWNASNVYSEGALERSAGAEAAYAAASDMSASADAMAPDSSKP